MNFKKEKRLNRMVYKGKNGVRDPKLILETVNKIIGIITVERKLSL